MRVVDTKRWLDGLETDSEPEVTGHSPYPNLWKFLVVRATLTYPEYGLVW